MIIYDVAYTSLRLGQHIRVYAQAISVTAETSDRDEQIMLQFQIRLYYKALYLFF